MGTISYWSTNMTEIIYKDPSGSWPQTIPVDQISSFGGMSIGTFLRHGAKSGTGFIVKLTPLHPTVCALVLTAARIFISKFSYRKTQMDFLLENEVFKAEPLKDDLDWNNKKLFFKDPISCVRISIPEDWVVCTLSKIPGKVYSQSLVPLQLINPLCILYEELEVTLYGYPKVPELDHLTYVAPESNDIDYDEIENSLCQGNHLVSSKGKIKMIGDILSVSCISANGMSGGPLIIESQNCPFVIGFLHGGPASFLHYYPSRLLNCMNPSIAQAFIDCLTFNLGNGSIYSYLHELLTKFSLSTISRFDCCVLERLLLSTYSDALNYEFFQGKNISYNNCLSIKAIFEPLNKILSSY